MGTVSHLQEVFAQLRSTINALPPLPPTSPSLSPSEFSEDLALIEASNRLTERTLPRVQIASFKTEQDLVQQLISRVVTSIETVIQINSLDNNKDLTKAIKWVCDFELKLKESAGVVDFGARSSTPQPSSPLPSHSHDSFNFAFSTFPFLDQLPPSSSAPRRATYGQQQDNGAGEGGQDEGQEGGEAEKKEEVLKVGEKHGRDEEDGEANEQSGEEEEDERSLRKKKRETVKLQEDEDQNSNDGEENSELEMAVDSDTGIVTEEWRIAHHHFIFLGSRSFDVLVKAISVSNDYFEARRNHQPPLSDDSRIAYVQPYQQLYRDWHIDVHNLESNHVGEHWKDLFDLVEEKGVNLKEFLTALRFIHPLLKAGFKPDIPNLKVYVEAGAHKHYFEAADRRRRERQPIVKPCYVNKKPNVTEVKLVATALKLFTTTRSIPVTIGSGSSGKSLQMRHSLKLLGSVIAPSFTFTNRFKEAETAQLELLYNDIKAVIETKPRRKKTSTRRSSAAGSVTGWIRNHDNDFLLETEDYSVSLSPLADQLKKEIKPLFTEREGFFSRMGEAGYWYAIKRGRRWTLARYDTKVKVGSNKVFICEI